ncbi:hypothetical protein Ciccas_007637 [Cichlidogyrus casuarinus]|uniref:Uncharacterized protein n=1 Tax=Cichlidogyrus casuarinus TaxID=1844966 RepID=A0ABD2Q2A5_9PLAT
MPMLVQLRVAQDGFLVLLPNKLLGIFRIESRPRLVDHRERKRLSEPGQVSAQEAAKLPQLAVYAPAKKEKSPFKTALFRLPKLEIQGENTEPIELDKKRVTKVTMQKGKIEKIENNWIDKRIAELQALELETIRLENTSIKNCPRRRNPNGRH